MKFLFLVNKNIYKIVNSLLNLMKKSKLTNHIKFQKNPKFLEFSFHNFCYSLKNKFCKNKKKIEMIKQLKFNPVRKK